MDKKEKIKQLALLVKESKDKLKEAEAFADEHALSFRWDNDYGSRKQEYFGKGSQREMRDEDDEDDPYDYKMRTLKKGKWMSSSDDCD